jgi:hypothetical protein
MNSEELSPLEQAMRTNATRRLAARVLRELLEGRATRAALVILVLGILTLFFLLALGIGDVAVMTRPLR